MTDARPMRGMLRRSCVGMALWLAAFTCAAPAGAAAKTHPPASHPFATHFLALQISVADHGRQERVLSVANNLLSHYGPDAIVIEVIAFGPGVRMLYADSPMKESIESLIKQGVRFDACGNTLDTVARKTGHRPKLLPHVVVVPVGVARLLSLTESGYAIVQP